MPQRNKFATKGVGLIAYTIKINAPLSVQQVHDLYQRTHFNKTDQRSDPLGRR